jgi:acyl transferase domain-containing protein/acyl carrier protein
MSRPSERQEHLSTLKSALFTIEKMRLRLEALERSKAEPIAIVGLGCRFPGGANDPEAFWRLLRDGADAVTDVPADRWDVEAFYDPNPETPGKMYTRSGSFLEGVDEFDPEFFGISPREAASMDPQQRLLLEVSWEALENAGLAPGRLSGSQTGVFIGICNRDYAAAYDGAIDPAAVDSHSGTGNIFSVAAGRLSYVLGLNGPTLSVDTACSSSLVAIHLACQSLRQRECDMALAGGVNLILSPLGNIFLARARALSPDGRCRTFDASADGYGRGEGCGVVVLKRLSEAVAAGDRLLAVIRGSAVNHDGRSSGLTVPNGTAQEKLLRRALENAGVNPAEVSYVEAHGTGTPLGDPIEVHALAEVLGRGRPPERPLLVGSVKTNIGHLEAAAGVAALIKVVLSLSHEEIPRHLHFKELNPHISPVQHLVRVAAEPVAWPAGNGSRIAGISSFGLSGTNAHIVVEPPPPSNAIPSKDTCPVQVLTLSAKSEEARLESARRFELYLRERGEAPLPDVCYTAAVGRSHFPKRLAVVAETRAQAIEGLSAFTSGQGRAGVFQGDGEGHTRPAVALAFTGEGSEYVGMGRQLFETHPVFRETLVQCDEILRPYLERPLLSVLYPKQGDSSPLHEPAYLRPALVSINYALARLWRSWGVEPAAVCGDGVGEYAAAACAGALTLESALRLAAQPGARELSSLELECAQPQVPFVSAAPETSADVASLPKAEHRHHPERAVTIARALQSISEGGCGVFLEIGPRVVLADRVGTSLPVGTATWLPSLKGDGADWRVMAESLAALYVRGIDVDWRAFHQPYSHRRLALPTYPFRRGRYWKEKTARKQTARADVTGSRPAGARTKPLLGLRLRSPIRQTLFESRYSVALMPWLNDHRFHGAVIVAGSTYLAGAIAGMAEVFKTDACVISDVAFPQPMLLEGEVTRLVQLILTPEEAGRASFQIVSTDKAVTEREEEEESSTWKLHAAGRLKAGSEENSASLSEDTPLAVLRKQDWESLSAEEFYRIGSDYGMQAGPSFRWINRLWRRPDEALAEMVMPPLIAAAETNFPAQPGLIDSCFQLLAACLPQDVFSSAESEVPVVVRVERFRVIRPTNERPMWAHFRLRDADTETGSKRTSSDFRLFDEQGNLLYEVSGVHIHLIPQRGLLRREKKQSRGWTHEIEWHPKPLPTLQTTSSPGGTWLIFCDSTGIGTEVAASLRAHGERCLVIFPGQRFESPAEEQYRLDPRRPEDFQRLLQESFLAGRPCRGIVHLWSLDIGGPGEDPEEAFEATTRLSLGSTLYLLKSLLNERRTESARLCLVTRGAQAVGGEDGLSVSQASVWGMGNVIASEHPELKCVKVDVDSSGRDQGAFVFNEIWFGDGEDRVAYRGGARMVPRLVGVAPVVTSLEDESFARIGTELFRPDATYLIAGGLGWLGQSTARWMVACGARRLIVLSRSPERHAADELLSELESAGAKVSVTAADVSQYASLARIIGDIDPQFPLRGVVHAAGVLDDCALLQMDAGRLTSVMSPKVRGAWNLHLLTRSLELDFFILFSSVASILGSPGQGNYAAANAFLDALAHHRHRQGLPALSINWGPWSGGRGMAADFGDASQRRLRQLGIDFIPPGEGVETLGRLLTRQPTQVAVLPIDWSRFLQHAGSAAAPFFSLLARSQKPSEAGTDSGPQSREVVAELEAAAPDERRGLLIDHLRAETSKVLGLPPSYTIDPRACLDEMGLDSLMAIELRNVLQETLNCSLPATLLYDCRTLAELSDYLLNSTLALEER